MCVAWTADAERCHPDRVHTEASLCREVSDSPPAAEPLAESAVVAGIPDGVGLRQRIRGIVSAVVVLSRLASLAMVVLSVAAGVRLHAYTVVPLAVAVYVTIAVWSAVFIAVVLRRDPVPTWVLPVDVVVTTTAVLALPLAVSDPVFSQVANPYLEPMTVSVAVSVALVSSSAWRTAAGCAVLAVAYLAGQFPVLHDASAVVSAVSTVGWQVAIGGCCYVFVERLGRLAAHVQLATQQLIVERERVAAQRAHTEERAKHFREQVRRYRALHDGPLRILTAIAGPGPAGHPDPAIRRQCAVSANILRGSTPDETAGTVTDLSLALLEAGGHSATYGLRGENHFANLPDDLPTAVVEALALASAEALANVATHAGTTRARLTAMVTGGPHRPVVNVAVVDQGKGFDVPSTELGYGIRHSITSRMGDVGGSATVDSHPAEGTRVDLRWPA
jgi:signal transduction histidine kinase